MKKSLLSLFSINKNYLGCGLIGHEVRSENVDQAFDEVIKELKLTQSDAFLFANSRIGRFLGDELSSSIPSSYKNKIKKSIKSHINDLRQE